VDFVLPASPAAPPTPPVTLHERPPISLRTSGTLPAVGVTFRS